ncbi:MAG TPA: response regulator transcription factor [Burkholderiaceae bacterium]|nr:response regulator transcription factor [Burkholderiaceae bacterium]
MVPALSAQRFDVALLDINLPDVDGFEALRRARAADLQVPILVITARDAVEDRVHGLEGGAEDYLVKPFALAELIARIRVLARRHGRREETVLEHGPLRVQPAARIAHVGEAPLALSAREWHFLVLLLANEGHVVSKEDLARAEDAGAETSANMVEVYIFRLRAKLEPFGIRIRTVRGFGYLLDRWPGGAA